MKQQQQQQSLIGSLIQNYHFTQWLMQWPALSLAVILRRDLGYRLLNPLTLIAVFGGMSMFTMLATGGNEAARPLDLVLYAAIGFLFGIAQRIRRWLDLNRGIRQHSYYMGTSPFDFRWLPHFIGRNRRVSRYVDPFLAMSIGFVLFPYSRSLAVWLLLSGFCLRVWEDNIFRRDRNRELDLTDSLIDSENQTEVVNRYAQEQNPPQFHNGSPVTTGIGEDIQAKIKARKASRPRN